jgi:hypothetical protein
VAATLGEFAGTPLGDLAMTLIASASEHYLCLTRSLDMVCGPDAAYVPPGPTQLDPTPRMTEDTHASYCNYRYLPEMISADTFGPAVATRVLRWRRTHGGELLAMTRFEGQLDDWPALHQARAMLETDDIEHYLLLMYAHWAHHCAQGHLTSYEQVGVRPDEHGLRRAVAGQVAPGQVMVPTMLRWALVYEERDEAVLWLCRAIPRRWLGVGERVEIKRVPTRFGTVGFTLYRRSRQAGTMILDLARDGLAAKVKVRLRVPPGDRLRAVTLEGKRLRVSAETVTLPAGLSGKVRLKLEFA